MASRLELHEELCKLLGSRNVYFQPPESMKLKYPCIKYSLSGMSHKRANNKIYKSDNRYEVIIIDLDPDSIIYLKLLEHFQMCSFERTYTADDLNHYVLSIYY